MVIFGLILVGFGALVAFHAAYRGWAEQENMTLGPDTPAKQARRAQLRSERIERNRIGAP